MMSCGRASSLEQSMFNTESLGPRARTRIVQGHGLTRVCLQEVAKKRTRRTVKSQRAIVGASLDVIKERRSMRPEARAAARSAAIKDSKEKKAEAASAKKAEKAKMAASGGKGQTARIQSKQGAKGAPKKVAATSR
jgi:large subunit ribosomal protein L24e